MNVRKPPFLLLEVLIALTLVTLCMIPLVSPYLWMIRHQQKMSQKIELSTLSNQAYTEIVQLLYQNDISWDEIESGTVLKYPIETAPYHIYYQFSKDQSKSNAEKEHTVLLARLTISIMDEEEENVLYSFSPKICLERKRET